MPVIVKLPQVGESVVEGIIDKWLKKPGDRVEKYDPLVEIVTDKVTMELPSPVAGVLSRILVEEGTTVPIGTAIAEIDTTEGAPDTAPGDPEPKAPTVTSLSPQPSRIGGLEKDIRPVGPTGGSMENAHYMEKTKEVVDQKSRFSPVVRRLAGEHGIDLSTVKGTGINGRITRQDVLSYVERQSAAPAVAPPVGSALGDEEAVAISPIRLIIATNMARSTSQIPHAWGMIETDVTPLVQYREKVKDAFQQREGIDLTYLPFVIKAVTKSLKDNPALNSSWGEDNIILKKRIHIGVAVATGEGLVVPVIHDADRLNIAGLARAISELTNKARQNKLALGEVQGGTFTINNTGALGSVMSYPIINYPQAAIITSEAIVKRPVVVNDSIAIRSVMNLCLSFDHRVLDGAEASAFLQAVKRLLESMGENTPLN